MPGWWLVASCRRSPGRSSASLSPGPRIQLRGREREVASPKPGPRTSQLCGPRARPPAGPAGPAPQPGLAQVRGNAQVRGPAQMRGAHAPEPGTASSLPARATWSPFGRLRPTTPAKPHSDGGCPRDAGGAGVRPPEGARQGPCTPTQVPEGTPLYARCGLAWGFPRRGCVYCRCCGVAGSGGQPGSGRSGRCPGARGR